MTPRSAAWTARRPRRTPSRASTPVRTPSRCARSTPRATCRARATPATANVPDFVKPSAPSDLSGTVGSGPGGPHLDGSTDNVGVTGYRIYRNGTQVGSVLGALTTFTHTNLQSGNSDYTVRAVDAAGNLSDPSNTVTVNVPDAEKPTAPWFVWTTAGAGQVEVRWFGSTDNVAVAGYKIYRNGTEVATVGQRRALLHRHQRRGHAELHGARLRRRGQPVRRRATPSTRDGGRHREADHPERPERHGVAGPGRAELDGLHGQRGRHRLPDLPERHPGGQRARRRHHVHAHGPHGRHVQLHGARHRRRGQPVRREQHRDGHGAGQHQAEHPGQPHGDRGHRPGRAALDRLDRQRRRDRLPHLPGRHADRERGGQRPHLHAHGCGRSAQLHGARDRRRRQPVRPEQHAERDGAGQHQADRSGQPHGDGRARARWC